MSSSSRNPYNFIVSREDWSLHRKGYQDQQRHQEKVREVIKNNLPDLVTEENIIMSNGKQVIKIPLRNLEEYRFIHNYQKHKHVGQGDGQSEVGDILGKDTPSPDKTQGGEAGNQPGYDVVEAEIEVEEIEDMIFDQFQLPFIEEKQKDDIETISYQFNDIRKTGIFSNIDKKRTILHNLRRNARQGKPGIHGISPEDLRFKTWEDVVEPRSNAVIIAMMDTSGSMGNYEKYCARSFFFWMVRFLRRQYQHVEIVFLAHHTEAKEVNEDDFFNRGESGGTICSSVYKKALEIIDERFPPSSYNIYPFHFSDGDNLTSDNERCVKLIHELLKRCNMFGYGEVNQYNRGSTLMSAYRHLKHDHFMHYIIKEKSDVYRALNHFFGKQDEEVGT